VDWETTDCLLCASPRRATVLEAAIDVPGKSAAGNKPISVVQCGDCGLCYTRPRPTPGAMARFYTGDYSPHVFRRVGKPSALGSWWRWVTGRRDFERDGPAPLGGRRLLDFGCGAGAFLQRMHASGWEVLGVDVSAEVIATIRDELGLPGVVGDLGHSELAPGSFDVLTMWQSLEHVHDPLETLRQAHALVRPGGRLIVSVPNLASLPFRWFGPAWFGLDLPRHLTHFSPKTLRRVVSAAGFKPRQLRMVRHSSWLQNSARAARETGRDSWRIRLLDNRSICRLAARYCALRGKADCMTLEAAR